MGEELKACPFCGDDVTPHTWEHGEVTTSCSLAGCPGGEGTIFVEQWNRRPIEDALRARVAELERRNAELAGWIRWRREWTGDPEPRDSSGNSWYRCALSGEAAPNGFTGVSDSPAYVSLHDVERELAKYEGAIQQANAIRDSIDAGGALISDRPTARGYEQCALLVRGMLKVLHAELAAAEARRKS